MGLLDGKRILITGVLTNASLAFGIASLAAEEGAELVLTGAGRGLSLTERTARKLAGSPTVLPLDVTDPEPLDTSHPLLHRPNVTVTPHVAAGTDEARVRMFQPAVEQAIMVIEGRRPPHMVNPEAWEGVVARL